ncbi:MAG: ABC transporter ATP-binding protein [Bacteriovoracaceae bacterium]|nr:ABC transporter ATP-binding protein [Bacteriovoracaceae bacterium]
MRLENIVLNFDSKGLAGLHTLSLHLHRGEILCILGPSGAGKSTLLKVLSGDLTPQRGSIEHAMTSTLMEADLKLDDTVTIQQLLMNAVTRSFDEEKKLQLARDLADAFEFPMQLKKRINEVSEGQKQRVKIAYSLVNQPELLLLDEPFSHLDTPLRLELLKLLKTYVKNREMTVVWVTHQREEALAFSDRLGIMHFGKWEQIDTPQNLFWRPKSLVVAQLLGFQNFVTVTRSNPNELWQTPYGSWNSQGIGRDKTHLVLSIPASSFAIQNDGAWSGKITQISFLGLTSEITVESSGHLWRMQWHGPLKNELQVGEICRYSVDLSHSVGIDCL